MVHLRVARESEREEVPLHFEGVPLKVGARVVGWLAAVALAAGGVALMVTRAGSAEELAGALAAACGGVLIAALVRCRRHELTVGRRWIKARLGPLHNDLATQLVAGAELRPATGWRRLFADREVVVVLSVGAVGPVLPTRDGGETRAALMPDADEASGGRSAR